MAIPITPKPPYPNVPQTAGVPPVLRQIGAVQNTIVTLAADAAQLINLFSGPQWGLFTADGTPAFSVPGTSISVQIGGASLSASVPGALSRILGVVGSSTGDVEFQLDHQISTAPQEQGAFMSYNKVSSPYRSRVTYIVSGLQSQRGAFLAQVLAVQNAPASDQSLLTLIMPEISYPSCNVVHHSYRRSSRNGVTMIAVDVWVEQVRVTGTAAYSNTTLPSGANQQNDGTVQAQPPTPTQQSGVTRVQ